MPDYRLWCLLQGDKNIFPAVVSSSSSIGELKDEIFKRVPSSGFARDLTLTKVRYIMFYHDLYAKFDAINGLWWLLTSAGQC